jgi:DNA-binding protein YbaB
VVSALAKVTDGLVRLAETVRLGDAGAINDATQKVEAATQQKMSALMGGLNLPAGFKLPF